MAQIAKKVRGSWPRKNDKSGEKTPLHDLFSHHRMRSRNLCTRVPKSPNRPLAGLRGLCYKAGD
jgi:hypothetical protein